MGKGKRLKEERRRTAQKKLQAIEKLKKDHMEAQELAEKRLLAQKQHEEELRAAGMAPVLIKCPETDKFFPAGVTIDVVSYQDATFSDNVTRCPHCKKSHRWGDVETMLGN